MLSNGEYIMKNRKMFFLLVCGFLIATGLFIFSAIAQVRSPNTSESNEGLKLTISSEKNSYFLGETVFLNFEVKNESSTDIRVRGLDLDSRYITVFISTDKKIFKQYKHSRVKDTLGGALKAGDTFKSRSGILWNFDQTKITASGNRDNLRKTHIVTDYAFPTSGEYFVKAILTVPRNNNSLKIESEPIQIKIQEPTGENLEVWNKIKDNGDFAYFIQEGDTRIPSNKSEERNRFLKEVEQILSAYPNSFYAESLQQSLDKFKADEVKIEENMRKN
jgi:hypothetical protein